MLRARRRARHGAAALVGLRVTSTGASARRCACRSTAPARCPAPCRSSSRATRRRPAADARLPLRRPGRRRDRGDARGDAARRRRCRTRYRVVGFDQRGTGGSGLLRCRALERDPRLRTSAAGEDCARTAGRGARAFYTTPRLRRGPRGDPRRRSASSSLTLFGISYGTSWRSPTRARTPTTSSGSILDSVRRSRRRRPLRPRPASARWGRRLAALCPARCRGVTARPGRRSRAARRAAARARRCAASTYDRRGRRHAGTLIGPTAIAGPDVRLRLQPADARRPSRSPCAPRSTAATPRRCCAWSPRATDSRELPSARSRSPAPATRRCARRRRCRGTRAHAARRARSARPRAAAALGARRVLPVRPHDAPQADEIDLCLHWPRRAVGAA